MRTVLYFQSSFSSVCRRVTDGVRDFAAKAGWRLHVVPYANAAEREDDRFGNMQDVAGLAALLGEWRADGCIIHWSPVWPDIAKSIHGIPCVMIDSPDAEFSVRFDNVAIGRAAATELLRLSPASCAYLSLHRPYYWCGERTASFVAEMRAHGIRAVNLGDAGESVNTVSQRLVESLLKLPRPCGLFAVNDLVARRAADAAEAAGLNIPFDIAIVGADDDESVCEGPGPTLTSIRPDFWRLGNESASLLESILEQPPQKTSKARQRQTSQALAPNFPGACAKLPNFHPSFAIPPLRIGGETIVRRSSSRHLLRSDPLVAAVLEDIRLRYAEPITAASIARGRKVCLRTLERRFLSAKGRTIGREIADARFRAAQEMLAAREWRSLDAIANFCGYDSDSTLRKAFHARLGLSPSAWRKSRQSAIV